MKNSLKYLTFALAALPMLSHAAAKAPIEVRIEQKLAPERYTDVNEFQISEERGTRYCGNAVVPKHAVNLPWLKDLRKPAGTLVGVKQLPIGCTNVLKWDDKHFCLDHMTRKARLLDLVRRCSEF